MPQRPHFLSADETPTDLDTLLARLDTEFNVIMDILGPYLGMSREKTEAIEADFAVMIEHIKDVEHGRIDLDTGLEQILQDVLDILNELGIQSQRKEVAKTASE